MVLPNKEYVPGIVHNESLRNLDYPLDWQGIVDYMGMPCVLKDAHGGGWQDVFICHTLDELIYYYNHTGLQTMILQEFIDWDHYVRCLCLGQEEVLPMKYDPHQRRYHVEHEHHDAGTGRTRGRGFAETGAGVWLRHELGGMGRCATACPMPSTS